VLVEPPAALRLLVGSRFGLSAELLDALPKVGRGGLRLVALIPSPFQRRLRLLQLGPRLLDGALQALNLLGQLLALGQSRLSRSRCNFWSASSSRTCARCSCNSSRRA
jgi:hypothetical protein